MHNASSQNSGPTGSGTIPQKVPQEPSLLGNASQNVSQNVSKNVLLNVPQTSQQMMLMQNDPSVPSVPTKTYDPSAGENPVKKDDVQNIYNTPKAPNLPKEPSEPKVPKLQDIRNVSELHTSGKPNDDDSDSDSDNHERTVHRNVKTSK